MATKHKPREQPSHRYGARTRPATRSMGRARYHIRGYCQCAIARYFGLLHMCTHARPLARQLAPGQCTPIILSLNQFPDFLIIRNAFERIFNELFLIMIQ